VVGLTIAPEKIEKGLPFRLFRSTVNGDGLFIGGNVMVVVVHQITLVSFFIFFVAFIQENLNYFGCCGIGEKQDIASKCSWSETHQRGKRTCYEISIKI